MHPCEQLLQLVPLRGRVVVPAHEHFPRSGSGVDGYLSQGAGGEGPRDQNVSVVREVRTQRAHCEAHASVLNGRIDTHRVTRLVTLSLLHTRLCAERTHRHTQGDQAGNSI